MNKSDKLKAYTVSGKEAILIASEPLDYDNTLMAVKIHHNMTMVVTENRLKEIQNNQQLMDKFTLKINKFGKAYSIKFKDKNIQDDNEIEGILMMLV